MEEAEDGEADWKVKIKGYEAAARPKSRSRKRLSAPFFDREEREKGEAHRAWKNKGKKGEKRGWRDRRRQGENMKAKEEEERTKKGEEEDREERAKAN